MHPSPTLSVCVCAMVTERVRVRAHSTHHTQATYPRAKRRTAVLSSRYHAFFAHSDLPLLHHRCLREGWQSLPHSLGDSLAPRPPLPVRGHSHCRHRLGVQGGALTCSRVSAHKGSPVSARQLRRYVACVCGWLGACACACVCACGARRPGVFLSSECHFMNLRKRYPDKR